MSLKKSTKIRRKNKSKKISKSTRNLYKSRKLSQNKRRKIHSKIVKRRYASHESSCKTSKIFKYQKQSKRSEKRREEKEALRRTIYKNTRKNLKI